MYFHQVRTPDISVLKTQVFLFSRTKRSENLYLNINLRKETDLAQITAKSRIKRPSKRARTALKNAASKQKKVFSSQTLRCCDSVYT